MEPVGIPGLDSPRSGFPPVWIPPGLDSPGAGFLGAGFPASGSGRGRRKPSLQDPIRPIPMYGCRFVSFGYREFGKNSGKSSFAEIGRNFGLVHLENAGQFSGKRCGLRAPQGFDEV